MDDLKKYLKDRLSFLAPEKTDELAEGLLNQYAIFDRGTTIGQIMDDTHKEKAEPQREFPLLVKDVPISDIMAILSSKCSDETWSKGAALYHNLELNLTAEEKCNYSFHKRAITDVIYYPVDKLIKAKIESENGGDKMYDVEINVNQLILSCCSCGCKNIVCKHIVALVVFFKSHKNSFELGK